MANENAVVGVDLKTQLNDSLIGTQTGGSLNVSPDMKEIILKNAPSTGPTDWKARLPGKQEWSVDHEGLVLNENEEYHVANGHASLKLEVDTTDDGTDNATLVEVPQLTTVDFTLTQELATTGGLDEPLWRYLRPAEREFAMDVSGTYVEPTSDDGKVYDALLEARDNRVALPFELMVMGKTFTGDIYVGDTTLEGSTGGEDAQIDLSLASDLDLETSGAFAPSIDPVFTAFMNKQAVDIGMLHYDGQGPESGTKKFSGSGYYSEVSISIEDGEPVEMSGTVDGDGPLAMATV